MEIQGPSIPLQTNNNSNIESRHFPCVAMSLKKFRDKYAIIRMAFLKISDCFLEQGLERNKRRRWRQRGEGEAPHTAGPTTELQTKT